jgi:hypothetical protein
VFDTVVTGSNLKYNKIQVQKVYNLCGLQYENIMYFIQW